MPQTGISRAFSWLAAALTLMLALAGGALAGGTPEPKTGLTDIAVSKTSDQNRVPAGTPVRWTVAVSNTGDLPVDPSSIVVSDPGVELTPPAKLPASLAPGESLVWSGTSQTTEADCPTLRNTVEVWLTEAVAPTKGKTSSKQPPEVVRVPDARPENDRSSAEVGVVCVPPPVVTPPPAAPSSTEPGTTVTIVTETPTTSTALCPRPLAHIGMVAPRRWRQGRPLRVAIAVHNRSRTVTAERVVARYRIPRGFALIRRPHRVGVQHGVVVIPRTHIAPRQSSVVWLTLRPVRPTGRRTVHRASVKAHCDSSRSAGTITTLQRSRPRPAAPRVTG